MNYNYTQYNYNSFHFLQIQVFPIVRDVSYRSRSTPRNIYFTHQGCLHRIANFL